MTTSSTPLPDQLTVMLQQRNAHTLRDLYGGIAGLARRLGTSLVHGMPDDPLQIHTRRQQFGTNTYPTQSPKAFFFTCKDPALFTVLVWALHALAFHQYGDQHAWYAFAVAVILTLLLTSLTCYSAQSFQLLELQNITAQMQQQNIVHVARAGRRMNIPTSHLVVGDIASLETGDRVPADGLFINGHALHVDESTLTGESEPVLVNRTLPFLRSGSTVIEGCGQLLVTGVGMNTAWARSMAEPKEDGAAEDAPLQDLNISGEFEVGHLAVFSTIVLLVLPEVLPLVVTLSLILHALKSIMDDGALVRRSSATVVQTWVAVGLRSIFLDIRKSIQFQLMVNAAGLSVSFTAAVSVGDGGLLTAVQMLWVSLIIGTLIGALALATEPPTEDEDLQRPLPAQRHEPLLSNIMIRNVVVQTLYQVVILVALQFRGREILRLKGPDAGDINNTIIFNAFALCQLFNEVNARKLDEWNKRKGLSNNRRFVENLCSSLAIQVIAVGFLSKFASIVRLSWQHWLICVVIGFFSLPVALLGRLIPVSKNPLFNARLGTVCRAKSQGN